MKYLRHIISIAICDEQLLLKFGKDIDFVSVSIYIYTKTHVLFVVWNTEMLSFAS